MKIAILGGSFNPIHTGHLFLADSVLSALDYDRIIIVPAYQSPFKPEAEGAAPKDRIDMIAASIAGDARLGIDDCELKRAGISYTIDTLLDIKERYCPEGKPGLIIGDDLASTFCKWNRAEEIAEEADIIMAQRLFGRPDDDAAFPYPHKELCNEVINISSRLVREKIASGENWHYLVPQGVRIIIEERGLYGCKKPEGKSSGISAETIFTIEKAARETLNTARFLHSRNTALMARDLCIRYGLDPAAGYLAGIAHDICKSMDDDELLDTVRSDGKEISALEKKKPGLLHGKAAAVLLKSKYGIDGAEILEAVSSHVTCEKNMGDLAKALYIADKIEVSRGYVSPSLREMRGSLDDFFSSILEETVTYLKSMERDVSNNALKLLSSMKKRKKNEKKIKG